MSYKTKHLLFGIGAIILASGSSSALAAPTVCTVVPSAGTPDTTIAVASNFYGPVQDLITNYFTASGQPGYGKRINVCHNSTTTLDTEIRTGTSGYSLFLAANAASPDGLVGTGYVQTGATSNLYARGIPVMFARYATVSNVQTLIPAVSSGVSATISAVVTTSEALSTANSQTVAMANYTLAPYGETARVILGDMGYTVTTGSVPAWMHSPLYDNIDLTFQSVTMGSPPPNKSGFVSKAQICSGIDPNSPVYTYIEFTNSKYVLDQKGILIKSGDSTQNALGASLFNYMLSNGDPDFWPDFLTDHCYGQISGALFKQKKSKKR
jgi:molybdate transport system substrate-binding protein